MSGRLNVREAINTGFIRAEGDTKAVAESPALFEATAGREAPMVQR